jgi:hypothetical protein
MIRKDHGLDAIELVPDLEELAVSLLETACNLSEFLVYSLKSFPYGRAQVCEGTEYLVVLTPWTWWFGFLHMVKSIMSRSSRASDWSRKSLLLHA